MYWFDKNSKLVAAVLLFVFMLAGCGDTGERAAKYLERGKAYFEEENYDKAKIEFMNVLQIDPKTAAPYFYLGRIAEKNETWRAANGYYNKAVELDPENLEARLSLGRFNIFVDRIDEAAEQAVEVLTREPENTDAMLLLASVLFRQNEEVESVAIVQEVLAADPGHVDAALLLNEMYVLQEKPDDAIQVLETAYAENRENVSLRIRLYQTYLKHNENDKAEDILNELVSNYPDELQYRVMLAALYVKTDRKDKAEEMLRDAIAADPEDEQRYLVLVSFLNTEVGTEEAISELETLVSQKPDLTKLQFVLAGMYVRAVQPEKAKNLLRGIIDKYGTEPSGLTARVELAPIYAEQGDYDKAKALIEEVLKENPDDLAALMLKGRIAMREKDYVVAIAALRTVLKSQPDSLEVLTLLGQAHGADGDMALSRDNLFRAVEAHPKDVMARLRLASLIRQEGDLEGALDQANAALEAEPGNVSALRSKAEILAWQGDAAALMKVLGQLDRVSPTGLGAFGKGRQFKAQKKYDEAVAAFKEALISEPDSMLVLTELVKTEVLVGKADAALARLNAIRDREPDHRSIRLLLGAVYMETGEYITAEKEFIEQLEVTPGSSIAYNQIAISRARSGDYEGAIQAYNNGLADLLDDSRLLMGLAQLYERKRDLDNAASTYYRGMIAHPEIPGFALGLTGIRQNEERFEAAIDAYEKAIAKNPNNVVVVNNLAYLLSVHRNDEESHKRAKVLALRLASSNQPPLLDTLGWVHYQLGEYDDAVRILSKVVEMAPDTAEFRYHLGMTYYRQGDIRAARETLSGAVSSDYDYDGVDEARAVYKKLANTKG